MLSVGIQQNNNVQEVITSTGELMVKLGILSECFSKTEGRSTPMPRQSAQDPDPAVRQGPRRPRRRAGSEAGVLGHDLGKHTEEISKEI